LISLTLKISKNSPFKNNNELRELFEKISHLRKLQDLKLHFVVPTDSKNFELQSGFLSSLKGAFVKTVKLNSFSFRFNQLESNQAFSNLLDMVQKTSSSLKKLDINVGEIKVDNIQYLRAIDLVQRLTSVEVLKLNSLSLPLSKHLENFLDAVYEKRQLRSFELREIKGALNKPSFLNYIEKFLCKRGLSKFDCGLTWDTKDTGARRTRTNQIDLKKVIRINPELRVYPQSAALYAYYDSDAELRWG